MPDRQVLAACRALSPAIRPACENIERDRRLPASVVRAIAETGAFRMLAPRAVGGLEVSPIEMIEVIESVARADSAAGWCVMVGATSGLFTAFLEEPTAREIFADPMTVVSGVFAPLGRAEDLGESYRVSGRWPFASGIEHCAFRMGGVLVNRGESAELLHILFRADETEVLDTWNVSGLRGTGSHDMVVKDVVVPKARSASLGVGRPRHEGALYSFPVFGLLALGVAAVTLGIAREAIDTLVALARDKRPSGSRRALGEREAIQLDVGRAEALVQSSRAFMLASAAEVGERAAARGEVTIDDRTTLRLAATHATRACAEAVHLAYEAGGGSSIYETSLLQRHFRDVHVATQHAMVAPSTYSYMGRALLGQKLDTGTL